MLFQTLDTLHMVLSAGLPVLSEKCSKYGADHVDQVVFARKAHKKHVCICGATWVG